MDIYDFTVVKPRLDAFSKVLDFTQLQQPHDTFAKSVGERWFKDSGAEKLRAESKVSYLEYSTDKASINDADKVQIEKDLRRTKAKSFYQASLRTFLGKMDEQKVTGQVRRVLMSFCIRNANLGYSQGMDYMAILLSAFQTEEQVFWTLCSMLEVILPSDFYSPPPASMNGYQAERSLLLELAMSTFPKIGTRRDLIDDFRQCLEIMAPKWFICICIDVFPLDITCMIISAFFFESKGHLGVIPVVLTLLQMSQADILNGEDIMMTMMSKQNELTAQHLLKHGYLNPLYEFDPSKVASIRKKARQELTAKWNSGQSNLYELSVKTFPVELLQQYQSAFRGIYKAKKGGVTKPIFHRIIDLSGSIMPDNICDRVFEVYDQTNTKALNFCELINCISVLSKGSFQDRLRLAFQCYDKDNNGFLEPQQVMHMVDSMLKAFYTFKVFEAREEEGWMVLDSPVSVSDSNTSVNTQFENLPVLADAKAEEVKAPLSNLAEQRGGDGQQEPGLESQPEASETAPMSRSFSVVVDRQKSLAEIAAEKKTRADLMHKLAPPGSAKKPKSKLTLRDRLKMLKVKVSAAGSTIKGKVSPRSGHTSPRASPRPTNPRAHSRQRSRSLSRGSRGSRGSRSRSGSDASLPPLDVEDSDEYQRDKSEFLRTLLNQDNDCDGKLSYAEFSDGIASSERLSGVVTKIFTADNILDRMEEERLTELIKDKKCIIS